MFKDVEIWGNCWAKLDPPLRNIQASSCPEIVGVKLIFLRENTPLAVDMRRKVAI
jgi:hypothetical protein